jgi:glycosyltransferase involved in cell wall biosynthesis
MRAKDKSEACNRRLAIFVPTLQYGGVERVMLNLAVGFAQRGFKVDLVAADARGHLRRNVPESINVIDLAASRVLASLPALVRYLRKRRPVALIAAMDHSSVVALWARKLAGVDTRIIATVHVNLSAVFNSSTRWRVRLLPFFLRYFYPWADEIVAVSKGVADDLAVVANVPRERIKVIYNPVVNGELLEKASEPVQHPWFTRNQPPVILGVGRLALEKGFDVLIRAFAHVRKERSVKLIILGEGDQRPILEDLIRTLGVDRDVCLAGYKENPYAYMQRAQLFVLSSRHEGFGLVLVEAMALGLPVISSDCESGPREILQDGRYGALVPVGSVEALTATILSNLDQDRQRVPRYWLQNFEVSTALDAYGKLIYAEKQADSAMLAIPQNQS